MLEAFSNAALELFEVLGALALKGGFAVGVVFPADAIVSECQLIVPRWAVGSQVLVGLKRRDSFGELLLGDERGSKTQISFRKTGVDFCGTRVMPRGVGKVIFVFC